MKREIKFRAWSPKRASMLTEHNIDVFSNYGTGTDLNSLIKALQNGMMHSGENYILMQYTGTQDKNKREIWEGDIVRDTKTGEISSVVWHGTFASFALKETGTLSHRWGELFRAFDHLEVIGNVYESPELLRKEAA